MGQLPQGSGLSGKAVLVTVALLKTLMSESIFFRKCPQSQGSGMYGMRSS